ncbi:MAG: cytochrome-c peroxidase [Deltaproteobacteria bacterium]|nr:cytochrome-c peroxidase [Deltaproteobacteria bacterium]
MVGPSCVFRPLHDSKSPTLTVVALLSVLSSLVACDESQRDGSDQSRDDGGTTPSAQLVESVRDQMDRHGVERIRAAPAVSPAMYALGQALAFDKLLSGNENISCLTCHHPSAGSDDDRALSLGEGGIGLGPDRTEGPIVPRNAPALFNLYTYDTMFWDSRVSQGPGDSLRTPAGDQLTADMVEVFDHGVVSAQAMFPVTSREEMRGEPGDNELADLADDDFTGIWAGLMARLGGVPQYIEMFEAAYPGTDFEEMSFAHAANAIAAFEIVGFESRDSPWERLVAGNDAALETDQLEGALLFFDNCAQCHAGSTFSDFRHHNTGLAQFGPGKGDGPSGTDDFGRERVTGNANDRYAFRTPPLFNVELTAPFGHAGQYAELDEHIAHYIRPDQVLRGYEIAEHVDDSALWPLMVDTTEALLASLSRDANTDLDGHGNDLALVERFLQGLTGDGARDLSALVPQTVPSGLPVED